MDLTIVKTLAYNAKVLQSPCISRSDDGRLALFHDSGIYILELQCNPGGKDSSKTTWHVCSIPPAAETLEFDLGVDRKKLMEVLDQEDIHALMLDRTLSPSVQSSASYLGYRAARWSSVGADQFHRAVLATLTMDHRLCIYEEVAAKQTWQEVSDLSMVLYQAMKSEDYTLVSNRISKEHRQNIRMQVLVQRSYALAALDMAWSPLYMGREGKQNFGLLVVIMKSGHLVLWKVQFPVTREHLDVVEVVDTGQDIPSSVTWCAITDSIGLASVGFRNGMLRSFVIRRTTDDDFEISEATVLWPDADLMAITKLTWCLEERVLLAAKGPYLLAFELQWTGTELVVNNKVAKLVSGKTPVCDLLDSCDAPYATIADNTIYRLAFHREEGLSIRTKELMIQRDKNYSFGNCGIAHTQNACYLAVVEFPNSYYCHLTLKMPLKVHMTELRTMDECLELLLEEDDAPLHEFSDCLARVHQYWSKHFNFPPLLDQLLASSSWHHHSTKHLKLARYLIQTKLQVPPKNQSEEQRLALMAMERTVERLLISRRTRSSLNGLIASGAMLRGEVTAMHEVTSIGMMCELLEGEEDEESVRLISLISQLLPSIHQQVTQTCKICTQVIQGNDLQKVGCFNGHVFSRCAQTLLLCQDLPYRVCQMCGSMSVGYHLGGSSWFRSILNTDCALCDFPMA